MWEAFALSSKRKSLQKHISPVIPLACFGSPDGHFLVWQVSCYQTPPPTTWAGASRCKEPDPERTSTFTLVAERAEARLPTSSPSPSLMASTTTSTNNASAYSNSGLVRLPQPLRTFFSLFPLYTHDAVHSPNAARSVTRPTLWVHPPRRTIAGTVEASEAQHLSADVECLKWQAYLALRGIKDLAVRFDVAPDGAIESRLPNLHVPIATAVDSANVKRDDDGEGDLLAAHLIPEWVARQVGEQDELEGYASVETKDESRAWVSLLEGNVHAALVC